VSYLSARKSSPPLESHTSLECNQGTCFGSGRSQRSVNDAVTVSSISCKRCPCWTDYPSAALLGRVQSVQDEVDKLLSGNEMLQMYIENLSKQISRG
jgi:Short coiled-coil protein